MGQHFLRTHELGRDAQSVWRDYQNYMENSTKADMQISKLMTDLISKKIESGARETSQEFILYWQDKMREYEELTPLTSHFPDPMKKSMLEAALQNLKCFREVKATERLDVARGRGCMSYEDYVTLVQNTAAIHDSIE